MSMGVIPIFWLEFLRVLEKNKCKKEKPGKIWHLRGPFAAAKGTLAAVKCFTTVKGCLTVANGCLNAARPKGQKSLPLGSPRRSLATPRRSTVHKGQNFFFLFPKVPYSYPDSLRTLIND